MLVIIFLIYLNYFFFNRGGFDSKCTSGHQGILCADCEPNYSKMGDVCVTCLDGTTNMLRIFAFLAIYVLFLLIYVGFSIKEGSRLFNLHSTMKTMIETKKTHLNNFVNNNDSNQGTPRNAKSSSQFFNPSKSLSIYLKIFLNYAQIIAIIHSLNMKWPPYVLSYLKTTGSIGTVSTQIFSLDCLIYDFKLDISVTYLKTLSTIVIYLGFLFLAILYFGFKKFVMKQKNQATKLIILAVVLSVLIQPNNIKESSDIFVCVKIDDKEYLRQQMSLECYTDQHNFWVNLIILLN